MQTNYFSFFVLLHQYMFGVRILFSFTAYVTLWSWSDIFSQLGGGYLFGLPLGFIADSVGATIGATAAFLLGRTVRLGFLVVLITL